MFKKSCFVCLTCQVLVCVGSGQELGNKLPIDPGRSELTYLLRQQDATKAAGSILRALMDELQENYAADPDSELREEIREREAFANKLQDLRGEAGRFANPVLLPALDSLIRDAQESMNTLKSALSSRVEAPNPDRAALKGQIEKLQKEIDLNNKLAKSLADTVKSMQDDYRREGLGSELEALVKTPGGGVSGRSPAAVLPDAEKEH